MKNKGRIFLTHSNEDKVEVYKLYKNLKAEGYQPWLDSKDLLPGQNWQEEISRAIKNSDIIIACISSKSLSKRSYIQKELRLSLDEFAKKSLGSIFLFQSD